MPLKGFLCEITSEQVSFDECLACARTKHPCQFTEEILEGMSQASAGRENAGISVTTCTGCLRKGYYQIAKDLYQYPSKLWPAHRGTAFHHMIEAHPQPGAIYERRFKRQLPSGVWLTGQVDKLVPAERLLVDFKSKQSVPDEVPEDYVWQINGYRWLVEDGLDTETGEGVKYPIDRLGLVWLTMMGVRKVLVETKPIAEVVEYFDTRASAIGSALDGGAIPERAYEPETSSFCQSWCPAVSHCLRNSR